MPLGKKMMAPYALRDFGSFYAGGRAVHIHGQPTRDIAFTQTASLTYDPNGLYHFEQAYVQYFLPTERRHALPIVFLHGGGMTGAMWEHTPDGRCGWLQKFVRQGHDVYIVDNVERGRAGWAPFEAVWPQRPIIRNAQESWSLFRFGASEDFPQRKAFAHQRFPIAAFDTFIQQAVPRWLDNNDAALRSFCAVLERVGPCLVLAHSHGGEVAYRAMQTRPDLVRGIIGIEPSGFSQDVAASAVAEKPFLFLYGDYLNATPLWEQLVDTGQRYAQTLATHGAQVTSWHLAEMGIRGNSHMLMMDDNSDDIAMRISEWILAQHAHA